MPGAEKKTTIFGIAKFVKVLLWTYTDNTD